MIMMMIGVEMMVTIMPTMLMKTITWVTWVAVLSTRSQACRGVSVKSNVMMAIFVEVMVLAMIMITIMIMMIAVKFQMPTLNFACNLGPKV